ncbi:hypothetical protein KAM357_36650 [Aeromonas caviae]|nr:hypothetical protein KAM346_39860 [Aeromonas caviae]GJA87607.1 hypothetical protein KAM356_36660 [Aeromonas caviae]GJA91717.1 hypothetical protein KAM357_36650 [Aeromonas caviae]GJB09029.1 hypothetical protein KAM361_37020 [Aeromonas caviae]GJB17694.1 hypothetical protein KAM363_36990 [Aeromonas caviae]
MAKPAAYFGYQWLLGHYLFAIVRIRFAIRTYNTDSGPSPWPSPEGEGMTRANTKPLIFTRTTEPTHNQRSLFAPFSHS